MGSLPYGGRTGTFWCVLICDLAQGMKKHTEWTTFPHYSTIRDVLNYNHFQCVPAEAATSSSEAVDS